MGDDRWIWLEVLADPDVLEAVGVLLVEWGAGGTVHGPGRVEAYYPPGRREDLDARLGRYAADLARPLSWTWAEADAAGWQDRWKAFFRPARVSERLAVCPSWEAWTPPEPGVRVLRIDPGRAFGTGTHETTRLCLAALDDLSGEAPGRPVLDVGCGSGILSIGALLLDAPWAAAVDVDPVASRTARDNARHNRVADRVRVWCGDARSVGGRYPVVVANILYPVLAGLAPALARLTAPGGALVLSGLLREELDGIARIYIEQGFSERERRVLGDWGAVILTRSAGT